MDVDAVDLVGIDGDDGPRDALAADFVVQPLALGRRCSAFESASPSMRRSGWRMTAPAMTGPARQPRPTSSTPATATNP